MSLYKNSNRDNITVQERLLDRMDDLLQLDVAIPEMADVLSEVRMSYIVLSNSIFMSRCIIILGFYWWTRIMP